MRWVILVCFIFTIDYAKATLTGDIEEAFVAGNPQMTEVDTPLLGVNYHTPEELKKFKEKIDQQEEHVKSLSSAIDRGDGILVDDLIKRKIWYRRGAAVSGFFGFTLDSIAPVLVTISTAAGGPTWINYLSGGMGATGTFLLGLVVYLKSSSEQMEKEISAIHEREKVELAEMKAEYHGQTKDINTLAALEEVKQRHEIEKEQAKALAAQAQARAAAAEAQASKIRAGVVPLKKRYAKKIIASTKDTDPLLQGNEGNKGKEEEK